MIDDTQLRDLLGSSRLIRGIDRLPRGHIRLETAFLYPDGSSVDLFVRAQEPSLFPAITLSDLGQTLTWLLDLQIQPHRSKRRQQLLADALELFDVHLVGGALEATIAPPSQLLDGVIRLGQACVRVADLFYTRRANLQATFKEEVEELLAEVDFEYETERELEGLSGRTVKVDFLVKGKRRDSALLTLSCANTSQAHVAANEIFRKWYDLSDRSEQRITIFDDRFDTYRRDDLERIQEKSDLVPLSEAQQLQDMLRAA